MARLDVLLLHPDHDVRAGLREAVARCEFLRVLGEAADAEEGLALLTACRHGAVFLGVDLAGEVDGFGFAARLAGGSHRPALVFVAADEGDAFQALELGATDYLRWPCALSRLEQTFQRLQLFKSRFRLAPEPQARWSEAPWTPPSAATPVGEEEQTLQLAMEDEEQDRFLSALHQAWQHQRTHPAVELEKLAITLEGRTMLLPYTQIVFVEAVEDYTYVHTASQKYLTNYRLKNLEERLRRHRFFRVHRKYLVNLEMVTEIAALPGSNFMLRTTGKTRIELPISRRRVGELKEMLGL